MPARSRTRMAPRRIEQRATIARGDPPSSVVRQMEPAADEDAGFPDEPFLQMSPGRAWPSRFHGRRFSPG